MGMFTAWPKQWPRAPNKSSAEKSPSTRCPSSLRMCSKNTVPRPLGPVLPRCQGHGRSACRGPRDHFRYANSLRKHERPDAPFLDQTGRLWLSGSLIGKIGSVFASTGTQHGGQETTITSFHTTLLHHGMVLVGVPYSESGLVHMAEISGRNPLRGHDPRGARRLPPPLRE